MTWRKGASGNPAGRPKGSFNKATLAALSILEGEAEAITRKAIELATSGDIQAIRLCVERLVPRAKEVPLSVHIPPIRSPVDATQTIPTLIEKLASGELLPSEVESICRVLEQYRKQYETNELEERLQKLEELYGAA